MARKKLVADERMKAQILSYGKIGCTRDEISAMLGVSRPTLWKFLIENPDMDEAIQAGLDQGKVTLRRCQWRAANNGNVTMQIWLGKQLLKQRDQVSAQDDEARESIEALRIEMERKLARVIESDAEKGLASEPDAE